MQLSENATYEWDDMTLAVNSKQVSLIYLYGIASDCMDGKSDITGPSCRTHMDP